MKTALSKVINQWDDEKQTPPFVRPLKERTTSTSEACFYFVKDNPGKSAVEATQALETQGHTKSSAQAIIYAMVRQNHIRSTDGKLYAVNDKYVPVQSASARAKKKKKLKPVAKAATAPTSDPVNHPSHYKVGGIETIDFIEAKQLNYNIGNVVKYITRAEHKGNQLQDLQKAQWYLAREIERVQA